MNRVTRTVRRAWSGLKAFTLTFAGRARTWYRGSLGRTRFPYASHVGDGRGNAMVMAVVFWFTRAFPEAPIRVQSRRGTELAPLPEHPLTELLANPNPFYPGELLWWGTLADWMLTGNGYWLKVRSAAGRVVQLWWAPATTMTPIRPDDGGMFLSHYEYSPNGKPARVEPQDVVHFRYGLNPGDGGLTGLSPLGSLLREVFTDDEAANFTASLLRNMGVPGVILAPRGDDEVGPEDAAEVKTQFRQSFGNDNVGDTMVMTRPTDVTVLSFNPQQMELTKLRRIPEERVSALFGIPAVVVGLGAGLDRSTYSNFAEAREAAYEQNVIPCQRLLAAQIRTQLLPDFGDVRRLVVDFDLSQVRVLQDDQNEKSTRVTQQLTSGLLMLDQALAEMGKPPLPNGKGQVFYVPNTVTVTSADELGEKPEPPPAPALALPAGELPMDEDEETEDAEAMAMNGQRRREAVPAA